MKVERVILGFVSQYVFQEPRRTLAVHFSKRDNKQKEKKILKKWHTGKILEIKQPNSPGSLETQVLGVCVMKQPLHSQVRLRYKNEIFLLSI